MRLFALIKLPKGAILSRFSPAFLLTYLAIVRLEDVAAGAPVFWFAIRRRLEPGCLGSDGDARCV